MFVQFSFNKLHRKIAQMALLIVICTPIYAIPKGDLIQSLTSSNQSAYSIVPASGTTMGVENNMITASSSNNIGFTINLSTPIPVEDIEMVIKSIFKVSLSSSADVILRIYGENTYLAQYIYLGRQVSNGTTYYPEIPMANGTAMIDMAPLMPGNRITQLKIEVTNRNQTAKLFLQSLEFYKMPPSNYPIIGQDVISQLQQDILYARPGDVILMEDGTYSSVKFIIKGYGNSTQPITIRAKNPGKVVFEGSSQIVFAGNYLTLDGVLLQGGDKNGAVIFTPLSKGCRMTNSAIINWNKSQSTVTTKWVLMYGTYNTVDHCFFRNKTTQGQMLDVVRTLNEEQHMLIESNYFGYFAEGNLNGRETVRINNTTNVNANCKSIVRNNYFDNCSGESEIISNKSNDNQYINNTFLDSKGALSLRIGKRNLVRGNLFVDGNNDYNRITGISICDEDHVIENNYFINMPASSRGAIGVYNGTAPNPAAYNPVKNLQLNNNTFINCPISLSFGTFKNNVEAYPRIYPPTGVMVGNNYIYSKDTSFEAFKFEDPATDVTFLNNYVTGNIGLTPVPSGIINKNVEIVQRENSLFFPNENLGANYDVVSKAPLTSKSFLPEWILSKINANDPNYHVNDVYINNPTSVQNLLTDNGKIRIMYDGKSNPIIELSLKKQSPVSVKIYSINGALIKSVVEDTYAANNYSIDLDLNNLTKNSIYLISIKVENTHKIFKIIK